MILSSLGKILVDWQELIIIAYLYTRNGVYPLSTRKT